VASTIRYCCSNFQWALEHRGTRGLSLAITEDKALGTGLVFVLEARSIDKEHEGSFRNPTEIPIYIASHVVIKFCPWCGTKLKRHYSRFKGELAIDSELSKYLGID
jgi:hypothetical protein